MQIQPILGYFGAFLIGVISANRPPLLDLGPLFLHILDPALFQTKHFSAVKFDMGYEKNMSFLVIPKFEKKSGKTCTGLL